MFIGQIPQPVSTQPSWLTSAMDIGKGLVQMKQQADIQKINMQRLQQGLPPIEAGDVAAQVKVGMDTRQLNKILLVSAGVVGAVLLVFMLTRRR